MKKITTYIIYNKRGQEVNMTESKEKAEKLVATAAKHGWERTIKEITFEVSEGPAEWWELEGYKQNPNLVEYNEEL